MGWFSTKKRNIGSLKTDSFGGTVDVNIEIEDDKRILLLATGYGRYSAGAELTKSEAKQVIRLLEQAIKEV